ncbi:MAG: FG-GAP-like repeat-containing protein [Flavobacteriaceae bacterium]
MKYVYSLSFLILFSAILFSCKNPVKDSKQKSIELMSAQTLGLAYLEEFKLEKAEKEFLKYIDLTPDEKLGYANLGLTYLRMGKYPDAKKQLFKAIKIDAKDADIRFLLAIVYQMNNEPDKAISELNNALKLNSNHIKVLYKLAEIYAAKTDKNSQKKFKKYTLQLVEKVPDNLVSHLNLIAIFIREKNSDKAIEQLEIIKKQFPEFPKEASEYYKRTITFLKKQKPVKALVPFTIFHNYLKVTSPYQKGVKEFKGPGGSLVGFPLITYDQVSASQDIGNKSLLNVIKFIDITASVGLDIVPTFNEVAQAPFKNTTHITTADYNDDGTIDIYVGNYDPITATYKHFLFNNDGIKFNDVAQKSGIKHSGKETSAIFTDYDNDGFLDLYVVKDNGDLLYRNSGKGLFTDVTGKAKIGSKTGGTKALFLDLDHDGDLDLFETKTNSNLVFRNNGDGTFVEQSEKMGLSGNQENNSNDAAFGDFDDDGDLDLFVTNQNGSNKLYTNKRQGVFNDIIKTSGLEKSNNSSAVAVGDYNNDGFLDLFITSSNGGQNELYRNLGDGNFKLAKNSEKMFSKLQNIAIYDAVFFDFDNDGFLDILIAGASKNQDNRGIFLYHNNGQGVFTDVSNLLPENIKSGKQIELFDYNNDGDLDILIAGVNGGVNLLRNDGGSLNHHISMKLVGLRTGSAKNNYFGIGSKVEMRAGNLYQTKVVTSPNVYFGLGNRKKVDVIRITWTNGTPQNIFLPNANQALIEAQTLKGSCPFLYTWDGEKYVFQKDIIWRSALGMPLGIMGGNLKHAFPNASDDYIKIDANLLKPKEGKYTIQLTSELWETIYIDKIQLVAVDHPDSVAVFVPEQFAPPPFPGFKLYQVPEKFTPVSAKNSKGDNLLSFITKKDDKYVSDFLSAKYQGVTTNHDLVLNPGKIGDSNELYLYLNGWIFPTDASINLALSQSDKLKVNAPVVQAINKKGRWETVIPNLGFPMGKDKTVIADLSGKFLTKDHRVRIVTNMEIYWDYIFFANSNPKVPTQTTVLNPVYADLHYRGFSKSYRKGGRYGPHWFDYNKVNKNRKWRDLTGNYTRYGDVNSLLLDSDNKYIISNAGDETSINFDQKQLPKLKKGWQRDFFIHSVGWVKDGDLNTATGATVLPLPYHGMTSYPPSKDDVYPNNEELQKYNKTYNTRVITTDDFKNALKTNTNDD